MVLGGRVGDAKFFGDSAGINPVQRQVEHLGLSSGELVGSSEQVGPLCGGRGADAHCDTVFEAFRPHGGPSVEPRFTRAHPPPGQMPISWASNAATTLWAAAGTGGPGSVGGSSRISASAAPDVTERTTRSSSTRTTPDSSRESRESGTVNVRATDIRIDGARTGPNAASLMRSSSENLPEQRHNSRNPHVPHRSSSVMVVASVTPNSARTVPHSVAPAAACRRRIRLGSSLWATIGTVAWGEVTIPVLGSVMANTCASKPNRAAIRSSCAERRVRSSSS